MTVRLVLALTLGGVALVALITLAYTRGRALDNQLQQLLYRDGGGS